jgi:hypothetical protein
MSEEEGRHWTIVFSKNLLVDKWTVEINRKIRLIINTKQ